MTEDSVMEVEVGIRLVIMSILRFDTAGRVAKLKRDINGSLGPMCID